MLPHNILGSWLTTSATLTELNMTVTQYIECSNDQSYDSGMHSINWIERTGFTFGDSDWSKTEGFLVFENRRAVLLCPDPTSPTLSHVIFLAMFASSLVNLQHNIVELATANLNKTLNAVDLDLAEASKKIVFENPVNIAGAEYVTPKNDKISLSDQPWVLQPWMPLPKEMSISKLRLRLGESHADVEVTRDGQLTFVNPDLSLDEVANIANEIIQKIPRHDQGGEQVWNQSPETGGTLVG
jgi:hypothetical protein